MPLPNRSVAGQHQRDYQLDIDIAPTSRKTKVFAVAILALSVVSLLRVGWDFTVHRDYVHALVLMLVHGAG